ncbi:MAG TPA: hypothetical protein VH328_14235, partial [Burkholderiaceae bacterium]|nr:hypothetical protein [Burkholderiaceae bacterium]
EARRRGAHGVVCGHIHHAELREIDGVVYANDGDWVESLTALVEHADGALEILDWSRRSTALPVAGTFPAPAPAPSSLPGLSPRPVPELELEALAKAFV